LAGDAGVMIFKALWARRPRVRDEFRVLRNMLTSRFGTADYDRWSAPGGLEAWWDQRTTQLAAFIPAGSRVIEFGAGRRSLERLLPPDCSYVPSDLTDRGEGTIVCDLNRRPFPDLRDVAPTVAVFSGVLEYIKDVKALTDWLVESGVQTFVLSFDGVPADLGWYGRFREHRRRLYFGYMNHLTHAELIAILEGTGLRCVEAKAWTHQQLYCFIKKR
jgi:hypothetical protein